MSIKYKILLPFFILTATIILSIEISYYHYSKEKIKQLCYEQLDVVGKITYNRLTQYVEYLKEEVNLFNSRLLLQKIMYQYSVMHDKSLVKTMDDILKLAYTNDGNINDIVLFDSHGHVITSKNKEKSSVNETLLNKMYNLSKEKGGYIHLSFIQNDSLPYICVMQNMYKGSTFVGVSMFKLKLDYLNKIVNTQNGLGKTGEALFGAYNNKKEIMLLTPLKFAKYPLVVDVDNDEDDHDIAVPMKKILEAKKHMVSSNYKDYRQIPVIASMYYFEPLSLGIVVKKDIEELMQPVFALKKLFFIIGMISVFMSFVLSLLVAKYITKNINRIVELSSQISQGQFYKRIDNCSNDELGILCRAVNNMADKLVNMNELLEKKVNKKTTELRLANDQLEKIFKITPNIVMLSNGERIIKANDKFFEFTGYESLDDFLKDYNCICDMFIERDGYLKAKMDGKTWLQYLVQNKDATNKALIEKDKDEYFFIVHAQQYHDDGDDRFVVVLENITEVQKTAFTDKLTGLANRLKIDETLNRCKQSCQRYKRPFSIILLDIDYFKQVNDNFGHLVGDEVLKGIAKVLTKNTRTVDMVGRWGGEEFIIISKETRIQDAEILAEKIRLAVESYQFPTQKIQTVSLGVIQYDGKNTIDEMLIKVDNALYEAKENGRNRVVSSK